MGILVTGAAGFLGRAVIERLLAYGNVNVRCLVRRAADVASIQEVYRDYPNARIDLLVGNLALLDDARRAVDGVDTIYHLAAGMRGLPATMFLNTVVASKCLIEAMQDRRRRVVLVSSIGVYGTSDLEKTHLIAENTGLDSHPEKRNVYFHAKIWQERLFREHAAKGEIDLVILRPGVLYGSANPSRGFPSRIGIAVGDLLLILGARNVLPLSYVVNCAEAVVLAGQSSEASGQSFNILDDNLPTAVEYIRAYKELVKPITTISLPFAVTKLLARAVDRYHLKTHGQIPAILNYYESTAMLKGHRFDNRRIKQLGWRQIVPTAEAMRQTFAHLHVSLNTQIASSSPSNATTYSSLLTESLSVPGAETIYTTATSGASKFSPQA